MQHRHGVSKAPADVEVAAILITEEQEKLEPEPEDPTVAEWNAFAQDHYEYTLTAGLGKGNTARILPATRVYIALGDSLSSKPKGYRKTTSNLELLAHVSAVVEPPIVNGPVPNLTNGVEATSQPTVNGQINGHMEVDKPLETESGMPMSAIDPTPISPEFGSTNPLPSDAQPPTVELNVTTNPEPPNSNLPCANPLLDTLPHDTLVIFVSDAVRASSEKLGIVGAVYHSVGNHLIALDTPIAQHRSTRPCPPAPTPPPAPSPPPQPTSSPSIKVGTQLNPFVFTYGQLGFWNRRSRFHRRSPTPNRVWCKPLCCLM
ncbi:hypothetical protein FRC11_005621 [Ceratobasidium sp. 423]|nr:hypothetical protein FRC11_005621 [Ceratobasidium sp. 423]